MKRSRFAPDAIVAILHELAAGASATEVCRRHGVSPATLYAWRKRFGGENAATVLRIRRLEEENARLRGELNLLRRDVAALKGLLAGNF